MDETHFVESLTANAARVASGDNATLSRSFVNDLNDKVESSILGLSWGPARALRHADIVPKIAEPT